MCKGSEIVLAAVPLKGVALDKTEVSLGGGLKLVKSDDRLRAAVSAFDNCLSRSQRETLEGTDWFLVLEISQSILGGVDPSKSVELLQDALMAFQIVKPVETYGLVFAGRQSADGTVNWSHSDDRRWPMIAGRWAQFRAFDEPLLGQAQAILGKVQKTMEGSDIGKRNAVHLLQLALEHPHPLVACLLAVIGIEAVLDSTGREEFERKLCGLLGTGTRAFPDWNSPHFAQPTCSVQDLALHLHTLRSKIAHGRDLREAARDRKSPVDLSQLREYMPADAKSYDSSPETVQYATILGEAAIYLLCQVLQRVL